MHSKVKREENMMARAQGYIGHKHHDALERFAKMYDLPISRLVAIAIDNEMEKDKPFKLDLKLPSEYVEYAHAKEAGKILDFMRGLRIGMSLDLLYIMRHDIGISDRDLFLAGFKECIMKEQIEKFEAPSTTKYKAGSILYRVNALNPVVKKAKKAKTTKELRDYAAYERVRKKLEREGKV